MNEEIEKLLQEKDISPTAMRILVLEYLQLQTAAISLADLEKHFEHAERTTLYRTLKTFEDKSLVHAISDGTDTTKYALCAEACRNGDHYDLHLHFYCYQCKQTQCLPRNRVPEIALPSGYELRELNLVAKGLCKDCAANNAIELHES